MNEVLYGAGWRQGTVFQCELPYSVTTIENGGLPGLRKCIHGCWVVVTQDCNLNRAKVNSNTAIIELRQVHKDQPPTSWGIHARKFLLDADAGHYIVDDKPSLFVSPKLLSTVAKPSIIYILSDSRVIALKTWLGNRYDRPAVPPELVDVAKKIAEEVGRDGLEIGQQVRDVYIEFETRDETVLYSLYAVIVDDADSVSVRKWLTEAALRVPYNLGTLHRIEALTADEISLALIESCYCADLSQLTWDQGSEAHGAI